MIIQLYHCILFSIWLTVKSFSIAALWNWGCDGMMFSWALETLSRIEQEYYITSLLFSDFKYRYEFIVIRTANVRHGKILTLMVMRHIKSYWMFIISYNVVHIDEFKTIRGLKGGSTFKIATKTWIFRFWNYSRCYSVAGSELNDKSLTCTCRRTEGPNVTVAQVFASLRFLTAWHHNTGKSPCPKPH